MLKSNQCLIVGMLTFVVLNIFSCSGDVVVLASAIDSNDSLLRDMLEKSNLYWYERHCLASNSRIS